MNSTGGIISRVKAATTGPQLAPLPAGLASGGMLGAAAIFAVPDPGLVVLGDSAVPPGQTGRAGLFSCRCLSAADQETWCFSRAATRMIA
jgi:hypothetical protein